MIMNIRTLFINLIIIVVSLFPTLGVSAQTINKTQEVELQIKELLLNKDVLAVNEALKKNNFLKLEYKYLTLNENLKIAKERDNPYELASTYLSLGNFWHKQGNKVEAYNNYLLCESASKKNKDFRTVGLALMNRSTLTENQDSRVRMVKEAISAFEQAKDTLNLVKAHLNIGIAYSSYVDSDLSNNFPQAIVIHESNKDSYYKKMALEHYGIAESLNKFLNNDDVWAAVGTYYAEWYNYEQNFVKAKELFENSKRIFLKIGNVKGQVYCMIELASIELKTNNVNDALNYLTEAEELSKFYEFNDYLVNIYDKYVTIYTSMGDYRMALKYHRLYNSSIIELNASTSQDKIHIVTLEHSLLENEYVIAKYQTEKNINRILFIVVLFFLVLIIVISNLMIYNKKRKIDSVEKSIRITELEKSSIEIKLKNQQLQEELLKEKVKFSQDHLILFANQVNKIENFLNKLKGNLKGLHNISDDQKFINSIKLSFSEIINSQNHLKQLNSYSSQLKQDFFFYIKRHYSNVSEEDEQLLAFIILNMSSKEISGILSISTESVYTKRYRLRKKLGLSNDESFTDFYQKTVKKIADS